MIRQIPRVFACLLMALVVACSSTSTGDDHRWSYDEAVRRIGRPPTRSVSAPDGSLEATWETHARDTTRQLIMTFDRSRRLTGSRNATVPRRR